MAAAIVAFALTDFRMPGTVPPEIHAVRLAQLAVLGVGACLLRRPAGTVTPRTVLVLFAGVCAGSALAGVVRGAYELHLLMMLVLTFGAAATLSWGLRPQLGAVAIAGGTVVATMALLGDSSWRTRPHMVVGIVVAFLATAYIAYQLDRYRRAHERAERALRGSEERFRALIEQASDVISIVDGEGVVLYESPALERVAGYRPDEAVGHPVFPYIHAEDRPGVAAALREIAGRSEPLALGYRLRRRDGSWCHFEAICTDLRDQPSVRGIVVNSRDVTERRRTEAQLTASMQALAEARDQALASTHAKSEFLAHMSHEIRTPMNAILGMTDIALDGELSPEQRDCLEAVRGAAGALLTLLNDLLDLSKIEAGKLSIERVPMDIAATMADVAELFAPVADAKGVELVCVAPPALPALPARLLGDPVRLRQVLSNLVGNAVKFTDAGEVVLAAHAAAAADGVRVRLEVRDTGVGIAPERQAAIFESFTQADGSTTRKYGGSGLGLTICRQLVELMGGRIGVESTLGRGSTFWLEITLSPAAAEPAATPPLDLTGARVLVVDASATVRRMLRAHLEGWGAVVREAASAAEAVAALQAALRERRVQLVLLDASRADAGGVGIADALSGDPRLATTPVVRLVRPGAREGGADALAGRPTLRKPVRPATLAEIASRCLAGGDGGAAAAPAAPDLGASAAPLGLHVLVVEDKAVDRRLALQLLERLGCPAHAVGDGHEALDALGRHAYDVVLMDLEMPVMDGFEATATLRGWPDGAGGRTPIVAVTARATAEDRARCLAAGMDDYLAKPVRAAELEYVLRRWRRPGCQPAAVAAAAPTRVAG